MALGIIGGTGVYDPDVLEDVQQKKIHTPYGAPSDLLTVGKYLGRDVVILPRHGANHRYAPHMVNYRANMYALKELGCTKVITCSAVGSLKEELVPGDFVFTDNFIDRTYGRRHTYYDEGQVAHIGVAEPFCKEMRVLLIKKAEELGLKYHKKGTCVVINGPRFSTKAESNLYRSWGADTVNMTLCPEVCLAVELEMCYVNIAMVTDYDVWKEHAVTNEMVLKTVKANIENVRNLLKAVVPLIDDADCKCNHSLDGAMM